MVILILMLLIVPNLLVSSVAVNKNEKTIIVKQIFSITENGRIQYLSWDQINSKLAIASFDGRKTIWDVATNRKLKQFGSLSNTVGFVEWSPSGKFLAMGSEKSNLLIYETTNWDLVYNLTGHQEGIIAGSWRPDSLQIATGSLDASVIIWDLPTNTIVRQFSSKNIPTRSQSVEWSPNGEKIVFNIFSNNTYLYNIETDSVEQFNDTLDQVNSAAWNGASNEIIFGTDQQMILWDGSSLSNFEGTWWTPSVAWETSTNLLASSLLNGTIHIWDVNSRSVIAVLNGHSEIVNTLAWNPITLQLASGSDDGNLIVWQIEQLSMSLINTFNSLIYYVVGIFLLLVLLFKVTKKVLKSRGESYHSQLYLKNEQK